jgi:hypothetical protein
MITDFGEDDDGVEEQKMFGKNQIGELKKGLGFCKTTFNM